VGRRGECAAGLTLQEITAMARIFLALAVFAVVLLTANLVLGLVLGDMGAATGRYAQAAARFENLRRSETATNAEVSAAEATKNESLTALVTAKNRFRPHVWLGVATALVAVLVNCISMTYFIGTSRWCREVVEAYGLDEELAERSRRLKRRSFPFAFLGMLTVVAIVALGGAADPGGSPATAANWVLPHFVAALIGIVVIAAAFYVQVTAVGANFEVIQTILAETERLRGGGKELRR